MISRDVGYANNFKFLYGWFFCIWTNFKSRDVGYANCWITKNSKFILPLVFWTKFKSRDVCYANCWVTKILKFILRLLFLEFSLWMKFELKIDIFLLKNTLFDNFERNSTKLGKNRKLRFTLDKKSRIVSGNLVTDEQPIYTYSIQKIS